jgi:hypothetical protein
MYCAILFTVTRTLGVGVNSQYKREDGCVVMLHIKSRLVPTKGCSVAVDDVVGGTSARQPRHTYVNKILILSNKLSIVDLFSIAHYCSAINTYCDECMAQLLHSLLFEQNSMHTWHCELTVYLLPLETHNLTPRDVDSDVIVWRTAADHGAAVDTRVRRHQWRHRQICVRR